MCRGNLNKRRKLFYFRQKGFQGTAVVAQLSGWELATTNQLGKERHAKAHCHPRVVDDVDRRRSGLVPQVAQAKPPPRDTTDQQRRLCERSGGTFIDLDGLAKICLLPSA